MYGSFSAANSVIPCISFRERRSFSRSSPGSSKRPNPPKTRPRERLRKKLDCRSTCAACVALEALSFQVRARSPTARLSVRRRSVGRRIANAHARYGDGSPMEEGAELVHLDFGAALDLLNGSIETTEAALTLRDAKTEIVLRRLVAELERGGT